MSIEAVEAPERVEAEREQCCVCGEEREVEGFTAMLLRRPADEDREDWTAEEETDLRLCDVCYVLVAEWWLVLAEVFRRELARSFEMES